MIQIKQSSEGGLQMMATGGNKTKNGKSPKNFGILKLKTFQEFSSSSASVSAPETEALAGVYSSFSMRYLAYIAQDVE